MWAECVYIYIPIGGGVWCTFSSCNKLQQKSCVGEDGATNYSGVTITSCLEANNSVIGHTNGEDPHFAGQSVEQLYPCSQDRGYGEDFHCPWMERMEQKRCTSSDPLLISPASKSFRHTKKVTNRGTFHNKESVRFFLLLFRLISVMPIHRCQ